VTGEAGEACLTVTEVASILRLSEETVYRLVSDGSLPARRFGRAIRVLAAGVAECQGYLTPQEVAGILRVSRSGVYDLVSDQRLPARRFGSSIRIPEAAVIAMARGQVPS
jgi:excisionase family DNA binding protein